MVVERTYPEFYWLTPESREFLQRGYLLEGVTAEQRIREIAEYAERKLGIEGFADKFYLYMSKGWFSLSTPIWNNYGNQRGMSISCFSSWVDDSIEGITDAIAEVSMMSKYGGGTSVYMGAVRPRGSTIRNNGKSNGSFSFLPWFESTINCVAQGLSRRGQCAAYIDIDHADIEEWLDIHTEGNPIQVMYYGVCVGNDWLEEMKAGDKRKRAIWAKVIQRRTETGIPYLFFKDNANNNKPEVYKDKNITITNSNLCVSPDTTILTTNGHEVISEIVGQKRTIWNGKEWSENVEIVKTASNKELYRVKLTDGKYLDCTSEHKWSIVPDYHRKPMEVMTKDIKPGMMLEKWTPPVIQGDMVLEHAYTNGFYTGDGCEINASPDASNIIYLYNDKQYLREYITTEVIRETYHETPPTMYDDEDGLLKVNTSRLTLMVKGLRRKYFVPCSKYTVESRLSWLAGYLDADGSIYRNGDNEAITASSVNYDFLIAVQNMLQTLGVQSKIRLMSKAAKRYLPKNDGSGEYAYYDCKASYRLLISSYDSYKLLEMGLKLNRLLINIRKPQRAASEYVRVESVFKVSDKSDTYCVTEPLRHKAVFNGILTHQCNEIYLPINKDESFVCCLSSMNLLHYDEWKNTDAVKVLTYFLDSVMSEFIDETKDKKYMERARRFSERHRALGLGVLGWHSYLQSNMIPFESFQAMQKNAEIFKHIKTEAYEASKELADRFGEPEILKGYGRRNTTLMAIAPTKSSSFILGQVSPSIEPFKSNYFVKDLAKSKTVYKNPYLIELLQSKGKDTTEVWEDILGHDGSVQHLDFLTQNEKDVFKTFSELSQMTVIQQAAQRQAFIDQGQSINIMVHPSTPAKDINQLYLTAAELGLKGLYYQLSMSAAQVFNRNLLNTCVSCEA